MSAPLWVREQKPLSAVLAVDESAADNSSFIIAFSAKINRTWEADDILSVKVAWSRLFPSAEYPEATEIGLHTSPGYLVENGEVFAMGYSLARS